MLFNSLEFAVFFGVVCALYFALGQRWRWMLLLVASYVFYMQWNASYAFLILASTCVDYVAGRAMGASESRRRQTGILLGSLSFNLGMLFTFKYWSFFHTSLAAALGAVGVSYAPPQLDVLLPVGISFYTFQTLSYTIDIWRGELKPERHFGKFALFVTFFPQLIAGPIGRAKPFCRSSIGRWRSILSGCSPGCS
ncbi:hypothetical protein [Lujinxingia vulgaris]|uniref:hypothetical protein n=1 Tax=Lujinxingia vulgaris TaxID=2600176 RepID=UPI001E64DB19|nr:hypothetical protein [Lujinxingia vulgaris]